MLHSYMDFSRLDPKLKGMRTSSTESTFRTSNTMLKLKTGKDATAPSTCLEKRLRGKNERRLIGKEDAESNRRKGSYRCSGSNGVPK